MIFREFRPSESEAVLHLLREPMDGHIRVAWGLSKLQAPPGCRNFRCHVMEHKEQLVGCALSWDWPTGDRYLGGLRFTRTTRAQPTIRYCREAYQSALGDATCAWTCIGAENIRARRVFERGLSCFPHYEPRQRITTWYIPLPAKQRNAPGQKDCNEALGIIAADWRHLSVASGSGLNYRLGRLLHMAGQPGITRPGQPMRIAYCWSSPSSAQIPIRRVLKQARGFDGIIISCPENSEMGNALKADCPRMAWKWKSILYAVGWDRSDLQKTIPGWKVEWL